jgi:hypothetical protein
MKSISYLNFQGFDKPGGKSLGPFLITVKVTINLNEQAKIQRGFKT